MPFSGARMLRQRVNTAQGEEWGMIETNHYYRLCSRFLDSKDSTSLEYKLDSFSSVYRRLTGKDVVFEFPVQQTQE